MAAAMRHGLLGGKRLRALLCLAAARDCGREKAALPHALAVELIHCYSLIHDDLPCMDNDAMRRGKPSVHAQFGEATAILAGSALQVLAFAQLAGASGGAAALAVLAQAAGSAGLCAGQDQDLAGTAVTVTALRTLHRRKTGAIFAAACELGAIAAGATKQRPALLKIGFEFGLMYQITDDISDAQNTTDSNYRGPSNYVSVLGPVKAQALRRASQQRLAALTRTGAGPTVRALIELLAAGPA